MANGGFETPAALLFQSLKLYNSCRQIYQDEQTVLFISSTTGFLDIGDVIQGLIPGNKVSEPGEIVYEDKVRAIEAAEQFRREEGVKEEPWERVPGEELTDELISLNYESIGKTTKSLERLKTWGHFKTPQDAALETLKLFDMAQELYANGGVAIIDVGNGMYGLFVRESIIGIIPPSESIPV